MQVFSFDLYVLMGGTRYPNEMPQKFSRFWPFCHFSEYSLNHFYFINIVDPSTKLKSSLIFSYLADKFSSLPISSGNGNMGSCKGLICKISKNCALF